MSLNWSPRPNKFKHCKNIESFQASIDEDAIKIMKHAKQEKSAKENLIFLIDMATIAIAAKDKMTTKEEPKMFDEAWNHAQRNGERQ